jgi:hypothetical protein
MPLPSQVSTRQSVYHSLRACRRTLRQYQPFSKLSVLVTAPYGEGGRATSKDGLTLFFNSVARSPDTFREITTTVRRDILHHVIRSIAVLTIIWRVACVPHAQARVTGADLEGVVRDESGSVISGAGIGVTNLDTNVTRSVQTDAQGHFIIPALAPGVYRITADVPGFTSETRDHVELQLGQSIQFDFLLKVAARDVVTVTADVPIVNVHDTSLSQVVGANQIENLPINVRNFISFAVITPGVTQDNTPAQGAIVTSGLSFAGQRARSNNIMVDGLDNNDLAVGAVLSPFSQEAVREFQVLTNSYSAEFGKASGGVVNIVTKSGTNEWRGDLFSYFRDRNLNATDHFEQFDVFGNAIDLGKAPFRQAQYGATLGGPVKKEHTFVFGSFERLDQTASNFVTVSDSAAAVFNALGFPVSLGSNPYELRDTEVFGKIDQQSSNNSDLVLRGSFVDQTNQNIEPFGGLVAKSRGAVLLGKNSSVSVSENRVLTTSWLNEVRFQYVRQDQTVNALDPTCSGSCVGIDQGGPTLEVAGVGSVGRQRFTPQVRVPNRIQLVDTVSYFRERHRLKTGLDYNWIHSQYTLPLQFGGRFIFPSLAALVAGTPAAYVQGYGNDSAPYTYQDLSLFVQDEWRVTSRITMKPGIRYQTQVFPDVLFDVSDLNGTRFRYHMPQPRLNFAPRAGVSFDPQGSGQLALHASYGLFYDNQIAGPVASSVVVNGSSTGVRTFVAAGTLAQRAWSAPGHRLTESQVTSLLGGPFPSVTISMDPGFRTPYAHQASIGFERAIFRGLVIFGDLLYVRGKHQLGQIDYNPRIPALGSPTRRPYDGGNVDGTSASVLQFTSFGETWYRGAVVSVQKRYQAGSQWLVSYTLSSAEDTSTDFQNAFVPQSMGFGRNPMDPTGLPLGFDLNRERGPSAWDQRHRLVFSGMYQLPKGLRVSAIATVASGRPFTPLAGADLNGDGNGGAAPTDRARTNPSDETTSVGRNSETLPNQFTVDLRLGWDLHVLKAKAVILEPLVEVFNAFNRTNYSDVNNVFGAGAFPTNPARDAQGRITYGAFTQALPSRQIQLAAKMRF